MIWQEKSLRSIAELIEGILSCKDKEEAEEFLRIYSLENEFAKSNIGYFTGYMNKEDKIRVLDWFDCEHPIFGKKIEISPMEALSAGIMVGELSKTKTTQEACRIVKEKFELKVLPNTELTQD